MPSNEAKRLDALWRYQILDTPAERIFDGVALVASVLCATPNALMSLIDKDRQWFKARVGLDATETPREHAFCAYTIVSKETFIVEDATADERFANNPLLTSDPHIRFCAGSPLIDRYGNALGSRCVMDRKPRRLSAEQRLRSGGTFTRHHRLPRITTGFRWAADAAHILDARRPGNDQAFARAVALGGVAGCGGENV